MIVGRKWHGSSWKLFTAALAPVFTILLLTCALVVVSADAFSTRTSSRTTASTLINRQPTISSSYRHNHLSTIQNDTPFRLSAAVAGNQFNSDDDAQDMGDDNDASQTGEGGPDIDNLPPRGGAVNIRQSPPALPTLRDYRKFALPCLGLWVAQPLLSLVDTAFVGLSSSSPAQSSANLAALGPATTFIDGATYLFAFLNVATTNLYSSARAQRGEQSDKAESVVRTASKIALRCGVGLMLFLLVAARPLLALYIGHDADSAPGLLDSAVDYVKIRAFSMPTSLLLGVIQAALLGAKDSTTPLISILYSTIINIVGDYLLVSKFQMGLRGAAIATLLAQWAATAALLGPARKLLVRDASLGLGFGERSKSEVTTNSRRQNSDDTVSGKSFLGFAAPVLTLILGKLAAFGFMTHSAAAVPGQPTPLASHQIILSLFFFVSPFMEVISQTAQTFMPPYLAPANDFIAKKEATNPKYDPNTDKSVLQPWLDAAFAVGNNLFQLGFVIASIVASLASLVPARFGNLLTSDLTVQEAVKPLAKYLWAGAWLTGPVAVSEGILLARRELKYLALVYVLSTVLLPPALIRVKTLGGNVEQVWLCFALFQLFRASCFAGKIWLGPILKSVGGLVGGKSDNKVRSGKAL